MTHPRRLIRDRIKSIILNGNTVADDRVWSGRTTPADVEQLLEEGPLWLIYTRLDSIKPEDYPKSGGDGMVKRTLELCLEGTATGAMAVDDKLDEMAEQAEALLENVDFEGAPATEMRLMSTEIDVETAFQQPVGGVLMTYEVSYWTAWRADTSDDDSLCGGHLRVQPYIGGNPIGAPETIEGCIEC